MTLTQAHPSSTPWLLKPIAWLWTGLGFLFGLLVLAWATLALYWSNLPWALLRLVLAIAFLAFGIYALWWKRSLRTLLVFAGLFLAVVGLYVSIQPSFNRAWQTEVAVLPQALRDGDRGLLKNFRNFDYRSTTDFTPRYESREVLLSHLTSLDFYVSYWMPGSSAPQIQRLPLFSAIFSARAGRATVRHSEAGKDALFNSNTTRTKRNCLKPAAWTVIFASVFSSARCLNSGDHPIYQLPGPFLRSTG